MDTNAQQDPPASKVTKTKTGRKPCPKSDAESEAQARHRAMRVKWQLPARLVIATEREANAYRSMAVKAKTLAERAKWSQHERESLAALGEVLDTFLPAEPKPARRQAGGAPTAPASGLPFEGEA